MRIKLTGFTAEEKDVIRESLTDDQIIVFDHLSKGETVVATSIATNRSERTVKRRASEIREKIPRINALQRRRQTEYKEACGP